MVPPKRALCAICDSVESKYTCTQCYIPHCSVSCHKRHKESCSGKRVSQELPSAPNGEVLGPRGTAGPSNASPNKPTDAPIEEKDQTLRPLTSLKWPYVPEESAYPDPLKRDDPKPLQLPQYEAIATSLTIRRVLGTNPRLREILTSIDALRGEDRELALQEALGVGGSRSHALASLGHASEEDRNALRELAEAVETAVRGGKQGILGLDWGE